MSTESTPAMTGAEQQALLAACERIPVGHCNLPAGMLEDAADQQLELAAQQEDARRIVLGEPLTAERARQITDYYQRSADA